MDKQLWQQFQQADPARGVRVRSGDVERVLLAAAGDITPDRDIVPHRRRPARFLAMGTAFAAVTAVAATVVVLKPSSVPGIQPAAPPSANGPQGSPKAGGGPTAPGLSCLTDLADKLGRTRYDGTSGKYDYLHTTMDNESDTMSKGNEYSVLWDEDRQVWYAQDGSGRETVTKTNVHYADDASRAYYTSHRSEVPKLGTTTEDFQPGGLSVTKMPVADPVDMAAQLYQPRENGPGEALVGVTDLNRSRVLDAPHRKALLQFLSATAGVTCAGNASAQGRTGVLVAVAVQSTPGGNSATGAALLMFDPGTGELIASGSRRGSQDPMWDTVWLDRGYSDTF